jgi:hypothetical protein
VSVVGKEWSVVSVYGWKLAVFVDDEFTPEEAEELAAELAAFAKATREASK